MIKRGIGVLLFGTVLILSLGACGCHTTPTIQLEPCRVNYHDAQCGMLRVYENRAARSGRMIDLKVVVFKATSDHPAADPVFYLAGGPGVAATEDAAKGQQFPNDLAETHDLVFVDQRGTGGSH